MMRRVRQFAALAAAAIFGLAVGATAVQSAPLLEDVHTIVGGDAATRVQPFEQAFTIDQAGSYDLTLTDLGLPAPFAALKLAVTRGATVVAVAGGAGTVHFDATAGSYVVRVAGALAGGQASGAFGVQIVRAADSVKVLDVASALALPPGALPANQQVLNTTFTVPSTGDVSVSLTDIALPQPLTALTLLIAATGGAPVLTLNAATASPVVIPGLAAGNYTLLVTGLADAGIGAGAFGARVRTAGGTDLVSQTVSIGRIVPLGTATLPACSCTLTLTDFGFPAALPQLAVALVQSGQPIARVATAGSPGAASASFTATAGDYDVLGYAVPASSPGTGTYGVDVRPQGAAAASFASVRTAGGDTGGTTPGYSFDVDVPSAGDYTLRLADFQFPLAFTTLSLAAVQSGSVIGSLNAAGTLTLSGLAAGKLTLLVAAQPASSGTVTGDAGLFGIELTPAAGGAAVYSITQGVGSAFRAAHVTLPAAGSYDVSVLDLGFPVSFTDLNAVVTQGATRLGQIFGGGAFSFNGAAGDVTVNVIAQPARLATGAAQSAGTYAVTLAATPPPTVTLGASATQVDSGATVTLTWSSDGATGCSASGGWSGARGLSGSETSAALGATTTFSLACTGAGGTTTQSVTVTVAAKSSGGGGALDGMALALLGGIAGLAARARRRGSVR